MIREEEIRNKAINEQKTLMESMDWRAGFISGSKWADKTMIEKACRWLKQNAEDYVVTCYDKGELNDEDLLNDFKKAMEE